MGRKMLESQDGFPNKAKIIGEKYPSHPFPLHYGLAERTPKTSDLKEGTIMEGTT